MQPTSRLRSRPVPSLSSRLAAFRTSIATRLARSVGARRAGRADAGGVLAAHVAGADAVKVFPARAVSPAYLGDLRAVLPDARLMPTRRHRGWATSGRGSTPEPGPSGSAARSAPWRLSAPARSSGVAARRSRLDVGGKGPPNAVGSPWVTGFRLPRLNRRQVPAARRGGGGRLRARLRAPHRAETAGDRRRQLAYDHVRLGDRRSRRRS